MDEAQGLSGEAALTELRRRLSEELARRRWTKTRLAARAVLGRTTVSEAFREDGPVPSEQTVAALADALSLPREELLRLRRRATGTSSGAVGPVARVVEEVPRPGRPIGDWDPHALEVHPAGPAVATAGSVGGAGVRALSAYVRREHDRVLAEVVQEASSGRSRIVVLVGSSSTGKTRACWEAVQPLAAKGWQLWHPFDPTRAAAALEGLHQVGPGTVVWLNEAQHYLGDREHGERIAAALHHLLTSPERGPVLVLGTLWSEYAQQYRAVPAPGGPDPHSRTREILSTSTLTVPEFFDASALAAAAELAENGDALLADTLTRAGADGRVAQDLAGAPALLGCLHDASAPARALLEAAMDARRLGLGLHLPQVFLTDAALDYLTDLEHDQLTDSWAPLAYAELATAVHGKQAPLRPVNPRPARRPAPPTGAALPSPLLSEPMVRLADYLEQHGRATRRHLCPPASFWHAAHTHLTQPDDLDNLAEEADSRYRLQWGHSLRHRATERGSTGELCTLGWKRQKAGDKEGAETLYRTAADLGSAEALHALGLMRAKSGDRDGAETLLREAADRGETYALFSLADMREASGDREGAEALHREAADRGDAEVLCNLGASRATAGDWEGAEAFYREAADRGNVLALSSVADIREASGDREGAEAACLEAADRGITYALTSLADVREASGDQESAEVLYRKAADLGDSYALTSLASMREASGDQEGAEALYRRAADLGSADALISLASMVEVSGDRNGTEAVLREAADGDNIRTLTSLAKIWKEYGDQERAEALYRKAAGLGSSPALASLAEMREKAGDQTGADALYRKSVDGGGGAALAVQKRWPFGLDPDGKATPQWACASRFCRP
ncbi:hypothetical protein ACFVU3_13540 [Streptomyces sp. NPDC058052]|uniref:hypothetical protein n=1 Tax=Streptomyces sp. NPDC058052 TaxID=3346316 RepID=UPI0036E41452